MKQFLRPTCTLIANGLYRLCNAIGRLAMWFDTCCMDLPKGWKSPEIYPDPDRFY